MRFVVEKTHAFSPDDRFDETFECESAAEAGRQMEDLCPVDAEDITECLWRGEDPIRDVDDETGVEVTVARLDDPETPPPMMWGGSQIGITIRFDNRKALRQLRQLRAWLRPGWLEDPAWSFPAWSPAWRPFDWSVDS